MNRTGSAETAPFRYAVSRNGPAWCIAAILVVPVEGQKCPKPNLLGSCGSETVAREFLRCAAVPCSDETQHFLFDSSMSLHSHAA